MDGSTFVDQKPPATAKPDPRLYREFRRRLISDSSFPATDRGLYQIMLLTADKHGDRSFTMAPAMQAEQLKASAWVVREIRRKAVASGLFSLSPTGRFLIRPKGDKPFGHRFTQSTAVGNRLRLIDLLTNVAARSEDGWARGLTERRLADLLGSRQQTVHEALGKIDALVETDKKTTPHRYRPRLELVGAVVKQAGRIAGNGTYESPQELLQQKLGIQTSSADSLFNKVVRPARQMLGGDLMELADKFGKMYVEIRDQRAKYELSSYLKLQLGGPTTIMVHYVDWLGESDGAYWILRARSGTNICTMKCTAFGQFRTDYAKHNQYDPVTGQRV